ncbi:kinesin-like protein KIF21A isoform X2 [Paramacrobiotus metropolitanus]|uniref:kinesin-like protein KIF21A isoform X2 n=1 Tax=Paramacrobiotus metropolitanus TaxID=2943436 RepID=UPI002445A4AC|nr:kinesin-like protein KIF21A isoform X2 [Paramacrobiotus metropolitanus]
MTPDDKTSVRVAVRVRPLSAREREEFQSACLAVALAESQIIIGTERAFTFDYTFNSDTEQNDVFHITTKELVDGCFAGFNATVLAYGQTGSGKTYTMGTGFDVSIPEENLGIIPRAVEYIFQTIRAKQIDCVQQQLPPPVYDITVQFIELYQDELIDLLDRATRPVLKKRSKPPRLGEDKNGNVCLFDVCTKPVQAQEEVMDWLKQGALARTTGATNMNAQSSRSHAIFTIHIKQSIQQLPDENDPSPQFLTTSAKFHFVDLAGSERLKRTKATGDRAKESIAINSGLLALGNVICKLGDKALKATHIPYRSSKLTRLLQDSLGGNSRTVMIACVSPAEQDFVETLNTLRYANRARNIQNKVSVNQDKTGQTISLLRARCQELEMQLLEYQQGKRQPGVDAYNDMFIENNTLQKENESLRQKLKDIAEELQEKQQRNNELRAEIELLREPRNDKVFSPSQNLTDCDKIRLHYCSLLEEAESNLKKKEVELERARSTSRTPPTSPYKTLSDSGSRTYRIKRAKPRTPVSDDKVNGERSLEGSRIEDDDDVFGLDELSHEDVNHQINVAEIEEQIQEKEKRLSELVEELDAQKQNYESKIQQLTSRIQEVELERNAYLNDCRTKKGMSQEEVRARDVKYQEQLEDLRQKLKSAHALRDENKRLHKTNATFQHKVSSLETEIGQLKRLKCEIMKKVEKDSKLARQKDIEQTRAISQKDKESRSVRKENADLKQTVHQLTAKSNRLRDELQAARRVQKGGMTDMVAGRIGKRLPDETLMKLAWEDFLKNFHAVVYKRMRLRAFEKQLEQYGLELKNLREQASDLEKRISLAAEKQDFAMVDSLKTQLNDTKATIHFISQQNTEIQNEAASCEETLEEYNYMDSAFLRTKFADEFASRYFVEHLLELCQGQHERINTLEKDARTRTDEHLFVTKERDILRVILQAYMMDSPTQTKVEITDFARSHLNANGIQSKQNDDIIQNILLAAPPTPRCSTKTKARQITLNGVEQMLLANGSNKSSSVSSGSLSTVSDSSMSDVSPIDIPDSGCIAAVGPFRQPQIPLALRLKKDHKNKKGFFNTPGSLDQNMHVLKSENLASPSKNGPNRSSSLNEIASVATNSSSKSFVSASHSLENLAPPFVQKSQPPVRRHPCQANLNVKPNTATPARK